MLGDNGVKTFGRSFACEHLVEDHAQDVQFGPGAYGLPQGLLGRDVARRAEHGVRHGDRGGGGRPCYAEVRHLQIARGYHQHVVRLYVAVNHTALVGGPERPGDLDGHGRRLAGLQRTHLPEPLLQGAARYVLHRDVTGAVLGLAPVVDTFTAREPHLRVEFGATEEMAFPSTTCATGVGFYPVYSDKPFGVF